MPRNQVPKEAILDADVLIVLGDGGRTGAAFIRGHKVPIANLTVQFGDACDPGQTIRQVKVTAGYDAKGWRASDQEDRDAIGRGSDEWIAAQEAPVGNGDQTHG